MRKIIVVIFLLLCLAIPCLSQDTRKREGETSEEDRPISDSRSFMELFTKLENKWALAVQDRNEADLDTLLAPEFQLRSATNPGDVMSRSEWIRHALAGSSAYSYSQQTMVIRAYLGVAIVSFVQSQRETKGGSSRIVNYLIVDLWEVNQNKWQAAARYISIAGDRAAGSQ